MKDIFIINEQERKRILNLHIKSTKNHYLSEQYGNSVTFVDKTGNDIVIMDTSISKLGTQFSIKDKSSNNDITVKGFVDKSKLPRFVKDGNQVLPKTNNDAQKVINLLKTLKFDVTNDPKLLSHENLDIIY